MKRPLHPPSTNLLFLDGLRGLAALYVLIGHARWLLWESYQAGYSQHPQDYSLMNKLIMYALGPFKYGHQAVLFFFVLSGFVIHLRYSSNLQKTGSSRFEYKEYLFKRSRRIYPPFVFAMLLCVIFDTLGKYLQFPIYSGTSAYENINHLMQGTDMSLKSAVGNLFFLYSEYVPEFGSNHPSWSLKFEWWFYMLYPVFLLGMRRSHWWMTGSMIGLYIVAHLTPWPVELLRNVFQSMLFWWLGVILCDIYTGRFRLSYAWFTVACWAGAAVVAAFMFTTNEDLAGALVVAGIISVLFLLRQRNVSLVWLDRLKPLGDFSYTLYITHFPLMIFISGWIMKYNQGKLPMHFGYVFLGTAGCLVVAYVVAQITEKPFTKKVAKVRKPELQPQFAE